MNYCNIKINTLDEKDLLEKFYQWKDFFSPSLDTYIPNIEKYVKKIKQNAEIIEAYNNNSNLIGILAIYLNGEIGYITHFVVHKDYRKIGVGKLLLNSAEKMAQNKNIEKIQLECFKSNQKGLNFYKNNFFVEINDTENKIKLEKKLQHNLNS